MPSLNSGVPKDVTFATKWQMALRFIAEALAAGAPKLPVVADAGYGGC